MRERARRRQRELVGRGVDARLYGVDQPGTGGLHAVSVITDEPEVYNLPPAPSVPTKGVGRSWLAAAAGAAGLLALAAGAMLLEDR